MNKIVIYELPGIRKYVLLDKNGFIISSEFITRWNDVGAGKKAISILSQARNQKPIVMNLKNSNNNNNKIWLK